MTFFLTLCSSFRTAQAEPVTAKAGLVWPVRVACAVLVASACLQATAEQAGEPQPIEPLEQLTDSELTDMAADWDALDSAARAELIQETRQRMQPEVSSPIDRAGSQTQTAASSAQNTSPHTRQTRQRRYGRIVRQADGTVIQIETRIQTDVHSGPATHSGSTSSSGQTVRDPRRAYGVGFERRRVQDPNL